MKSFDIKRSIAFISGILVVLFALLPALQYENLDYTGYEILLGKELFDINPFDLGSIASAYLPFSIWALFAYTLPLIAAILLFTIKKSVMISVVLFITGFFLLITVPNNIEIVYVVAGIENTTEVDWTFGLGLIGSIVSAGIGTLMSVLMLTTKS